MKLHLKRASMLAFALAGFTVIPAMAAPTVLIYENGVLTAATCSSIGPQTTCATSDANFTINSQTRTASTPAEITVTGSVNPAGTATFPETLTVAVYQTGFTSPIGGATLVQTANTNTNPAVAAPGSFMATGFLDNT